MADTYCLSGGNDEQFDILDISIDDIEYVENRITTNEDREIFLTDAGIESRDIEYFSYIDEIMDYNKSRFNSYKNKRDLLKLCAEFMAISIDFDDMHSIYVKKSKDFYRDSLKNIKLNNAKYIINKADKRENLEFITVPFISKVYVNKLKKTFLYPANKKIKVQDCRHSIIYGRDYSNYFHIELNNILSSNNSINEKFKYRIEKESIQDTVFRIINYYKNKSLYYLSEEENQYECLYSYGIESEKYKDIDNRLMFLKSKPVKGGDIIENLYYCFDIDNKLNLLEKIINNGLEDKNNNTILDILKKQNIYAKEYEKNIDILIKQNAKNSRLEQICKKRYPNFFNPASKEFMFYKHSNFNITYLPTNVQKSLNTEYNLVRELEEKMLENKCGHKKDLQLLRSSGMDKLIWYDFKNNYISKDSNSKGEFHKCSACSYPLICQHETEYYDLYFKMYKEDSVNYIEKINQILTTKYSPRDKEKQKNQSYSFCKICGMEIVKMLDTDSMNYSESESMYKGEQSNNRFSDSNEKRVIMSVINRNLSFNKPVSRTVVNGVVNGIYESIVPIMHVLNKKKKKETQLSDEQSRAVELNLTIMTIVSIMTLGIKYDFIEFKKKATGNKNIIIKKNNKLNIGDRFREAWDIFYDRYRNLLNLNSGKNNIESFKKVFIKCYDLLKETIGENIYISDSNISSHTSPSAISEYYKELWKKSIKKGLELEYKQLSDTQFRFIVDNDLLSLYLVDRNDDNKWKEFYEKNKNLNKLEKVIMQKKIKNILYPYWRLPYSYARYYTKDLNDWSEDMSLYACPFTGQRHNWNIYKFKSKKGEINSFKIKDISKNDSNLEFIKNGKLLSLQCSDCSMDTVELISKFGTNNYYKTIEQQVNFLNDIKSFYSTYKYRCLNAPFHNFKQVLENKTKTYSCSDCGIKFSYILNLDKEFYAKNTDKYISFINNLEERKNREILSHKNENEKTNNISLKSGMYGINADKQLTNISLDKKMNEIKQISIDKRIKQCMQNLGKTELFDETVYYNSDIDSNEVNNMFSKTVDRLRQIIIYAGILIKNPYKHKFYKREDFIEAMDFIEVNSEAKKMLNNIHNYLSKEKILDSVYSYSVSHPDGKVGALYYAKSIILHVIGQVSKYDKIFNFFINNIIDSDLLYTNYNYAELKKTYNMNKLAEDSINAVDQFDADENNESMNLNISKDKTEGFELFESSDLSMNNFEDDDIE